MKHQIAESRISIFKKLSIISNKYNVILIILIILFII